MRNGMGDVKLLGAIILVLLFVGFGIIYLTKGFGGTSKTVDDLQSCKTLIGNLVGKADCMVSCPSRSSEGYYEQFGPGKPYCPNPLDYCCALIPNGDNPISATQLSSSTCGKQAEGSWSYGMIPTTGQRSYCVSMPDDGVLQYPADTKLLLYYKPRKGDTLCKVLYGTRTAPFVIENGGKFSVPVDAQHTVIPEAACDNGVDANGVLTFYIGDRDNFYQYFGIDKNTVLLEAKLSLLSTSGAQNSVTIKPGSVPHYPVTS